MPFVDLPERDLKVYYVMNAERLGELAFSTVEDAESKPLDPSKPTLLFLHSGTLNTASYSKQFEDKRLHNTFNLVAMDSRFQGRTHGKEVQVSSLEEVATDLVAAIDKLDLGNFAIVGEGVLGCVQAVWIRLKRPNQVRSLMLISPGPPEESEEMKGSLYGIAAWFGTNKDGKGDKSGEAPIECLAAGAEYFFGTQERLSQRKKEWTDHATRRYGAGHSNNDMTYICANAAERKAIPKELLASITCPVLILQGAQDFVVSPIEGAKAWQSQLVNAGGGCDLRIISDGPHLLAYSDFNIVNRMILAFCSRTC